MLGAIALRKVSAQGFVDSSRALAERKLFLQTEADANVVGDESLNSLEAFKLRQKLRRHPEIVSVLDEWWDTVIGFAHQHGRRAATQIAWPEYQIIYRSLFRDLSDSEDEYDEAEADQAASAEFANESTGGFMAKAQFCKGMFEIADLHTPAIDVDSYVEVLSDLLGGFRQKARDLDKSGRGLVAQAHIVESSVGTSRPGNLVGSHAAGGDGSTRLGSGLDACGVLAGAGDHSSRSCSSRTINLPIGGMAGSSPPRTAPSPAAADAAVIVFHPAGAEEASTGEVERTTSRKTSGHKVLRRAKARAKQPPTGWRLGAVDRTKTLPPSEETIRTKYVCIGAAGCRSPPPMCN